MQMSFLDTCFKMFDFINLHGIYVYVPSSPIYLLLPPTNYCSLVYHFSTRHLRATQGRRRKVLEGGCQTGLFQQPYRNLSLSFHSLKWDRAKQTVLRKITAFCQLSRHPMAPSAGSADTQSTFTGSEGATTSLLIPKDSFPYPAAGKSLTTGTFHQSDSILIFPPPVRSRLIFPLQSS